MKLRETTSGENKLGEYYGAYDFHFEKIQEKQLRVLEIGVQGGGSLRMWEKYFPNAEIVGIDTDPHCKVHETERIKVHIGDQSDLNFICQFKGFDIIIDDGGHTMNQQFVSFDELFREMNPGGIYVIEDLHTSYWSEFWDKEGGFTTVNFLKDRIEDLNVHGISDMRAGNRRRDLVNRYGIDSIHFHESMCFIYKK